MVVAIEPMINLGTHRINHLSDGWTILTKDGKPSAHFEHDIAIVTVNQNSCLRLSTFMMLWGLLVMKSLSSIVQRCKPVY